MTEQELILKLEELSENYYKGNTLVSDDAYDALEEELRKINPNSDYFKRNREKATGYGDKYPHIYSFIGSIDKIHSIQESKILNNTIYTLSAKLDGTSMVAYYQDGKLVRALTRGDGKSGMDVTQHYEAITAKYRLALPKQFTGAIRGEVIFSNMSWEQFKSIHPEAKLPRNSGTGLVNQKTVQPEETLLDFVTYDLVASTVETWNSFSALYSYGFKVAPNIVLDQVKVVKEDYLKQIFDRWSKEYPLDGLVIRRIVPMEHIDNIYKSIHIQEAYKFQAETKVATVASVSWDLGRTGKLIPVIQIEPTELSGAIVTNITGHNAKNILDRGIAEGSQITVRRSGEVIPFLDEVLVAQSANLPTTCPYCGQELTWTDTKVDLMCTNEDCEGKNYKKVSNYILTMCKGVKGIGESFLEGFIDFFKITNIEDMIIKLNEFDKTQSITTLGNADNKIATTVIQMLTSKELRLSDFWQALGIKLVGESFSQELASSDRIQDLMDSLMTGNEDEVSCIISNILPTRVAIANSIISKTAQISLILRALNKYGQLFNFTVNTLQNNAQTRLYSVTGSLSKPRKEFEAELLTKGWKLTENIAKAEFLINNDSTSQSSKNQKAQAAGKSILTEEEFREKYLMY